MSFNSMLGRRKIVKEMSKHPHASDMASKWMKVVFVVIGPIIIRLFGWPLGLDGRIMAKHIMRALPNVKGKRLKLLDAGSSFGGTYTFEIAKKGFDIIAIDTEHESVHLGAKINTLLQAPVEFRCGDILKLEYPDEFFDVIFSSHVLEHILDDEAAINEFWRVLKPSGTLLLSLPYDKEVKTFNKPMGVVKKARTSYCQDGHWRSGYNESSIQTLLKKFYIENIRMVKIPTYWPESPIVFPLAFPLSKILPTFKKYKIGLLVRAIK